MTTYFLIGLLVVVWAIFKPKSPKRVKPTDGEIVLALLIVFLFWPLVILLSIYKVFNK